MLKNARSVRQTPVSRKTFRCVSCIGQRLVSALPVRLRSTPTLRPRLPFNVVLEMGELAVAKLPNVLRPSVELGTALVPTFELSGHHNCVALVARALNRATELVEVL